MCLILFYVCSRNKNSIHCRRRNNIVAGARRTVCTKLFAGLSSALYSVLNHRHRHSSVFFRFDGLSSMKNSNIENCMHQRNVCECVLDAKTRNMPNVILSRSTSLFVFHYIKGSSVHRCCSSLWIVCGVCASRVCFGYTRWMRVCARVAHEIPRKIIYKYGIKTSTAANYIIHITI